MKPVLAYYRRIGQPAYPADSLNEVEVLTPKEYAENYGGEPELGPCDGDWNAVVGDVESIDEQLGLCGDLTEIGLLCDAMYISVAVHRHISHAPSVCDEDNFFRRDQLDSHDEAEAERLFATIKELYGEDAEAAARRQYAS